MYPFVATLPVEPQDVASRKSLLCRIFPRTDLAVEARAIHRKRSRRHGAARRARRGDEPPRLFRDRGARARRLGENALCKPIGDYYTLALDPLLRREDDAFENAAQTLAELLRGVLPLMPDASVLVVGLGNRAITPDAVGPDAIDSVMVTRHLREQLPEHFGQFRPVAALAAGVLGTTGVEKSADMIRALAAYLHPDAIIAVDALACAELGRLGRTVQLTDTGITPGSGVSNDRAGLSRDTLGIPVAAIGLPTVVTAGGFSDDPRAEQMFVTPRDIDTVVRDAAKLIGYGINLALHDGLTIGDVDMFLS